MLEATPDLVGQIRALANPLKGTDYSKEPGSGSGGRLPPPPVPVELLDAGDEIMTVLLSAVLVARGAEPVGRFVIMPGTGAAAAHSHAQRAVNELLAALPAFSELEQIEVFASAVLGQPADPDGWTIAKAMRRWTLVDEPWWAAQPCPMVCTCRAPWAPCATASCGTRAVKVSPPRSPGDETRYKCAKCGWEPANDDDGFWAECFSRREGKAA